MKNFTLFILLCFLALQANAQCWKSLSAGQQSTVGIKTDGTLWQFGDTFSGGSYNLIPTQIGTANNWKSVSVGNIFCLAIKTDGTLWGWGITAEGQFGNGTTVIYLATPTQIGTANDWQKIFCSSYASFAIKTNGTLWSSGKDIAEILGNGLANGNQNTFIQVGIDTNWSSISCSGNTASVQALKTNGERWAWGDNSIGTLGDGTIVNKSVPTHIGTDLWKSVSTEGGSICSGVKTNGTLWIWGGNTSSPFNQVGTANDWETITCGRYSRFATKTNGDLLTWGTNNYGQLGNGTTASNYIAPAFLTNNTWQIIAPGFDHVIVQNASGTYSWGLNDKGQLGDGTTVNKYVPTLIACPVLATDDFTLNNKIAIYPNPNNGNFYLENSDVSNPIAEIKIVDVQGKLVFNQKTISGIEEIKISGLQNGLYLVTFIKQDGTLSNQKMMIQ
jgi:alpha-tubulin suppressor-like RCC1 family protein